MKVGDSYKLLCGHVGKIKMILEDTIAVKGPTRGSFCVHCNPRRSRRHPTVYLISLREGKDPILPKQERDRVRV